MAASVESEKKLPIALMLIGVVLYILIGLFAGGPYTIPTAMAAAMINLVMALIAAYAASALIGTGFGELGSAVLKLVGMILFVGGVTDGLAALTGVGAVGFLAGALLYYILLMVLFDLESREALIFLGILVVVRIVVGFIIAAALLR